MPEITMIPSQPEERRTGPLPMTDMVPGIKLVGRVTSGLGNDSQAEILEELRAIRRLLEEMSMPWWKRIFIKFRQ